MFLKIHTDHNHNLHHYEFPLSVSLIDYSVVPCSHKKYGFTYGLFYSPSHLEGNKNSDYEHIKVFIRKNYTHGLLDYS